jgi:hypothetical protein
MDSKATSGIRKQQRGTRGQSLVELCAGICVGIPILLACIDMGFIALGATINDNVCRDAVRAAASGPPASETPAVGRRVQQGQSPHQRVLAVIKKHNPTNLPLKVLARPEIVENVRDVPPAVTGGAVDGDIIVQTTVSITPPFILRAYCPTGIELSSKHLLPFTYVVLPPKKALAQP